MRSSTLLLSLAMLLSLIPARAEGASASIRVVANRSGGQTTFSVQLCLCLSASELIAYSDNGAMNVTVNLGGDLEVTENDFWNDDELGGVGGSLAEPQEPWSFPPVTGGNCPPMTAAGYTAFASIGPVNDSEYSDGEDETENPADFQLGELGEGEGDVPDGTTITIPGIGVVVPTLPNHRS